MDFFKKFWNKIKKPYGIWLLLFYIFFVLILAGTLTLVILKPNQTIFHYILYAISAISLTYAVYSIIVLAPKIKEGIIKTLNKNIFTQKMLASYGYRTIMFSIFSFSFNILYVIFMLVLAILSSSAWYYSITAYYLVLSLVKGNVFYCKKRFAENIDKDVKTYRFSGIMFIFLTIAFSGIIVLIYTSYMYFEYAGLMIYAIATYTFYKLGLAIYNIFKARKQDDWYVQNIRNINLANALISLVVLQVALFQAFSPEYNTSIANGLTGGLVSLIILALGIYMIVKANKNLYKRRKDNERE